MNWYDKYVGLPYKLYGMNPDTGIDCFNLNCYILKKEIKADIGYSSMDFCNIVDDNWSSKINNSIFAENVNKNEPNFSWIKVDTPQIYDLLLINIGSTNVVNHSAMYVDINKLLQIIPGRRSWLAPYGKYYKQYTLGIYRWNGLLS